MRRGKICAFGACIITIAIGVIAAVYADTPDTTTTTNTPNCSQYTDPNSQNICNKIVNDPNYGVKQAQQDLIDTYTMAPPVLPPATQQSTDMTQMAPTTTLPSVPTQNTAPATDYTNANTSSAIAAGTAGTTDTTTTQSDQTNQPEKSPYYPQSRWDKMKVQPRQQNQDQGHYNIYQ